ncbi:MAG: type II toxin-antitoxin system Phd/YefM family antitoxin [Candidatus Saccharibacteria bacterium]
MKTITAKELRNNLDSILERVNAGEEIIVKHRFRDPVRLVPNNAIKDTGKKMIGLAALDNAPRKEYFLDPNKSYKELYHDALDKKYGL